ncbi:hypothetical protein ACPEIC_33245 [Stenotrophomonas sp. NPDC087984]
MDNSVTPSSEDLARPTKVCPNKDRPTKDRPTKNRPTKNRSPTLR